MAEHKTIIEEMAQTIFRHNPKACCFDCKICAETLVKYGYRRAEKVRKETAKEIIEKLIGKRLVDYDPETNEEWATWLIEKQDLQFLIDEYGVELDDNNNT